jgi:uncharacterized protein
MNNDILICLVASLVIMIVSARVMLFNGAGNFFVSECRSSANILFKAAFTPALKLALLVTLRAIAAAATVLGISLVLTATACNAKGKRMSNYPAAKFFKGDQLALANAVEKEDIAAIERLAKSVDLNRPGNEDMTLLYFAMLERKYQAIATLIKLGANPEQQVPGIGQPISMAVRMKEPKLLKAMLDAGANPNAKDAESRGGTPILFEATDDDNIESLNLLLAAGANPNAKDTLGQTATYGAVNGSSFFAARTLIDRGTAVDVTSKNGLTFAWVVHKEIERQQKNPDQLKRIAAIKELMMQRGIKFPPDPPQVVRQKLGIPE